jgi:integrase/recombinase XerD
MTNFTDLPSGPPNHLVSLTDQLRLEVAADLTRFKGSSRDRTESDLRCYLVWCAERGLDPLGVRRPHLELYIRWMQEIRRFKPSTVSRRFSIAAGFYRTCVIDGLLEHSPAEHVRRPPVPPESPTLGFTHLQFEALLTAARESPSTSDFALVALLGLLGLRIFEATGADIADLGEEHGHRVLRVCGKGTKVVLIPLPPAVGRAIDRAVGARTSGPILLNSRGARMDRHAAARRLRRVAESAGVRITRPHPHMLRHTFVTTMLDAGVDPRDVQIAARHADPRTTMRYDRARKNLDRHPNDILAAYIASGTRPSLFRPRPSPGRRPTLPNRGHCDFVYLRARLYATNGRSDHQFSIQHRRSYRGAPYRGAPSMRFAILGRSCRQPRPYQPVLACYAEGHAATPELLSRLTVDSRYPKNVTQRPRNGQECQPS